MKVDQEVVVFPLRAASFLACLLVGGGLAVGQAADVPDGIQQIESEAAACPSAAAAARVYAVALTSSKLSGKDRAAAEERHEHWLTLAKEGRQRVGSEWLNAEERKAKQEEADRFIAQSFDMIRLGNNQLAEDHLKDASRRYLESGRADMILGLVYAMAVGDSRRAATHFAKVIEREPGNAYALNNYAVTALAARKYSVAVRYFRRSLSLMPDSQEICDNLAVTLRLAGTGELVLPENELEELSELYGVAIHDLGLKPYGSAPQQASSPAGGMAGGRGLAGGGMAGAGLGGGPSLMPPGMGGGSAGGPAGLGVSGGAMGPGGEVRSQAGAGGGHIFFSPFGRPMRGGLTLDSATIERLLDDPDEMVTGVWSGTGVALGDGFVLTTLDVIGDATKVLVRKPQSVGEFLSADVVASSDETGLALIDCIDLDVPAIPVAEAGIAAAGEQVLVGGFEDGFSNRLSGTMTVAKPLSRGEEATAVDADLIVALPKRENAAACGTGGIVMSASGGLVGLIEGTVSPGVEERLAGETVSSQGGYGVGVGAAAIRNFLEEEMDEPITSVSSKPGGWKDVVNAAAGSAVFIYAKEVRPGKPNPAGTQFADGEPGGVAGGFGISGFFGGGGAAGGSGPNMQQPGPGFGSPPGAYGLSPQGFGLGTQSPSMGPQGGPQGVGMQAPGLAPLGGRPSPQGVGLGPQAASSGPQAVGLPSSGAPTQGVGLSPQSPSTEPQGVGLQAPRPSP